MKITAQHIDDLGGRGITLSFCPQGTFKFNISGTLVGRLRDRFKTWVFMPRNDAHTTIFFTLGDVQEIDNSEFGNCLVRIKEPVHPKKKRRNKKKSPVSVEADSLDFII